jgi:hypothetical protein
VAVIAGEPQEELVAVGPIAQRKRSQVDACRPALGMLVKPDDILVRQPQT